MRHTTYPPVLLVRVWDWKMLNYYERHAVCNRVWRKSQAATLLFVVGNVTAAIGAFKMMETEANLTSEEWGTQLDWETFFSPWFLHYLTRFRPPQALIFFKSLHGLRALTLLVLPLTPWTSTSGSCASSTPRLWLYTPFGHQPYWHVTVVLACLVFFKTLVIIGKYLVPLFTSESLDPFDSGGSGTSVTVLVTVVWLGTKTLPGSQ